MSNCIGRKSIIENLDSKLDFKKDDAICTVTTFLYHIDYFGRLLCLVRAKDKDSEDDNTCAELHCLLDHSR